MSKWEWRAEVPTSDEVRDSLGSLAPLWGVLYIDFAEYVLPMSRNEKVKHGAETTYVESWKLYMQVAGRVAIARQIAEQNGWGLHMSGRLIRDDPYVWECEASFAVDGNPLFVSGQGVAKIAGGDNAWEKMETAARGRALGAIGIGVLPGSGLASLDEMEMVDIIGVRLPKQTEEAKDTPKSEVVDSINEVKEQLRQKRGQDAEELDGALVDWVNKTFGVDIIRDDNGVLQWELLNKGKLLLVHSNLVKQVEKLDEAPVPD